MEASTLRSAATLPKPRIAVGAPLLRLRSDEQLVALFRAGHEEAFRAIHDRYHRRLFAYARQMLPGRQDAEDVLQDVFVRAYAGLRASDAELALRAWLFRVAHNRCIDQLRKPATPPAEVLQLVRSPIHDPLVEVDLRESLRRLVDDIRRLPEQQRSALLMRELAGMSYADMASSLGVSVGAVKSLLVRARLALAQASEARETACTAIREQLVEAHDRGIRPNANTRRHIRDCSCCKSFRRELRGVSRELAAVAPAVGPLGFLAKLLGFSGGGGGGGAALLGGGGTTASAGGLALSTSHVATLIVAAVATAGGAVEIQRTILPVTHHPAKVRTISANPPVQPQTPAQGGSASNAEGGAAAAALTATTPATGAAEPAAPAATPVKQTDRDSPRGPRASATKPKVLAGSSTAAGTSTSTAGAATAGSCAASSASTTGSSTGAGSTTTSTTSTTTPPAATGSTTSSSTPASPAASSACGSTAGSSTSGSASSSGTSSSGSTAGSTGSGTTTSGSGTDGPPNSNAGAGTSGSTSNPTGK